MKFVSLLFLAVLVGFISLPFFHVYDFMSNLNMRVDYNSGRPGATAFDWLLRLQSFEGKTITLIFGAMIVISAIIGMLYAFLGRKVRITRIQLLSLIGLTSCLLLRPSSYWFAPEDKVFFADNPVKYSYGFYVIIAGFAGAFLLAQLFEPSASSIDKWRSAKSK